MAVRVTGYAVTGTGKAAHATATITDGTREVTVSVDGEGAEWAQFVGSVDALYQAEVEAQDAKAENDAAIQQAPATMDDLMVAMAELDARVSALEAAHD